MPRATRKAQATTNDLRARAKLLAQVEDFRPENVLVQVREKSSTILTLFNRVLDPLAKDPEKPVSYTDMQRIKGLMDSWLKMMEVADRKLDELQRRHLEIELSPEALARYDHLKDELREQYEGKGPQYEILIESVARIHVYLGEMFTSGRLFGLDEMQELARLEREYVDQLQSRTESSKFEVMEVQINEACLRLLHIVKRHVTAEALRNIINETKNVITTVGLLEGPMETPARSA